jgi:hypothetical protein
VHSEKHSGGRISREAGIKIDLSDKDSENVPDAIAFSSDPFSNVTISTEHSLRAPKTPRGRYRRDSGKQNNGGWRTWANASSSIVQRQEFASNAKPPALLSENEDRPTVSIVREMQMIVARHLVNPSGRIRSIKHERPFQQTEFRTRICREENGLG